MDMADDHTATTAAMDILANDIPRPRAMIDGGY